MKCPKCSFDNSQDTRFCGNCAFPLAPDGGVPPSRTKTLQTPVEELFLGTTFSGRYYIIRALGRGGMGKVYEALDRDLDEKVALKLISPDIGVDEKIIQRFRNELKLTRKIVHKNVCRMFDLNKDGETHYISMEYVPGEDLKSTLSRIGPLSLRKSLNIAGQICEGLAEAHRLGVIHRDLKPQNIMIDKEGNVRIMDFGIARSLQAKGITEEGHVVGTMEYMSPEQVEGKTADERSDIYSVGVIIYEMSTGRTPFEGNTPYSIAAKHISMAPVEPRAINAQIPEDLNRVIMKCLEKDMEKRFQKAEELHSEIEDLQKRLPAIEKVVLKKKRLTSKDTRRRRRRPRWLAAAGILTIATLTGIGLWQFLFRPAKTKPSSPAGQVSASKEDFWGIGQKYREEKRYSEARAQFQQLLALEPGNFEARLALASVLRDEGRADEAITEFERTISLNDSDPRPFQSLGEIYEQRNEPEKSLSYYQKYLEKAPAGPDSDRIRQRVRELEARAQASAKTETKLIPLPEVKRPVRDAQADMNEGIEAFKRGDYDLCIQQMERILKTDPENPSAGHYLKEASAKKEAQIREARVQEGLRAARKAFAEKDYQKCVEEAEDVLRLNPDNSEARESLNLAREQLVPLEIQAVLDQYVRAFNATDLLSFYQERCSPEIYPKIKGDLDLIMSVYTRFRAVVSNLNIQIKDLHLAEASFSVISTAESKKDGRKQALFEGTYIWDMEKQGDHWRIIRIMARPAKKASREEDS